jgi:hypothetical protein
LHLTNISDYIGDTYYCCDDAVTTERAELPTIYDSFPGKNKKVFSSPKCPDPPWAQAILYSVGYVNSFFEGRSSVGGLGSVVDIATAYGLDGPGIESRWERDFPHMFRPALRPTQPPVKWVPRLSRGEFVATA